ncbi:hypothetical protein AALO_G00090670 [Alosa alosa]|uniref:Uncharacterized protein n=1 Tax=Alosa alosa TaxID=278164 RepID=A0AAV6GXN5_9TELE|nr:hypothetical protein AALO_G00090670 [Alosa alosa]
MFTEMEFEMSGFTEPTLLPMPVKEIKEEEFDDFLQEHLFAVQKEEEKPGLDHDCKTETHTSAMFHCKEETSSVKDIKQEEEKSPLMEIKQKEEYDVREYGQKDSSPTEDPHRRKPISVFYMWEEFQDSFRHHQPSAHTYKKKAITVHYMWEEFFTLLPSH